jgi:hypothetical protein
MTSSPATVTIPTAPPSDFSDWFSPILVKELRQGLKSRSFVLIFILVQVIMVLLVGMQLLSQATGGTQSDMRSFDGFFWAFVWIPLVFLMPARGLTAISEEVKANTLDLVQLTKLSAFRIVLGKWVALVAQTLLLVAAILPYAVLRYFFGQVDVVSDLTNIGLLLMLSLLLTAAEIALSSTPLVVRIIVIVMVLPSMMSIGSALAMANAFGGGSFGMSSSFDLSWWIIGIALLAYIFLFLEIAAGKIAPASENHSSRKRVVALALALATLVLLQFVGQEQAMAWFFIFVPLWSWITFEALTERTLQVPSVYGAFTRRGLLGQLALPVLSPGWASGLVFTALMIAIFAGAAALLNQVMSGNNMTPDEARHFYTLLVPIYFTSLITPVCLHLWLPRFKQPGWLYILSQALFLLLFIIASVVASAPNIDRHVAYQWLSPFPASALLGLMQAPAPESLLAQTCRIITLPVCGLIVLYLFMKAIREFRRIQRIAKPAPQTSL